MKIEDIPQDGNRTHWGKRKALYAQDKDGEYKIAASLGWEVEEVATSVALDDLKRREEEAKEGYFDGKLSPLAFYMYKNRMDLPTLSSSAGICKWRIKRHFKPSIFKKLDEKILKKYAIALNMNVCDLLVVDKG